MVRMTNLTQAKYVFARARTVTPSDVLEAARPHSRLIGGLALTLAALVVSLIAWGPEMEFPVTVSTEEVATADGTDFVTLERTVREVAGDAIDDAVGWMTREGAWIFGRLSDGVTYSLLFIADVLKWLPWPAVVIGLVLVSYAVRGWSLAIVTSVALLFIGFMGLWPNTIDTIALMIVAVAIAVSAGLPLGLVAASSRLADNLMRPVLDAMQTMPSFVYLIPGILFFGLGKPAGVFATIVYAVPPVIRLTALGVRHVSPQAVEAARSFGASPMQVLIKVQIPMALPTIMAGINQTTMMALAMVTIASMVAAGGLGDNVLRALQKNQPGNGAIAGLAIVLLAIVIDRITQAFAGRRQADV